MRASLPFLLPARESSRAVLRARARKETRLGSDERTGRSRRGRGVAASRTPRHSSTTSHRSASALRTLTCATITPHDVQDVFGHPVFVWVRGGNVFTLRMAMACSGIDDVIVEGVAVDDFVYAGFSAERCVFWHLAPPSPGGLELCDSLSDCRAVYGDVCFDGLADPSIGPADAHETARRRPPRIVTRPGRRRRWACTRLHRRASTTLSR